MFEGKKRSELIIGSSNLTAQGLFTNVESSILISIDNKIDKDKKIVKQLKDYFTGIFRLNDPNLKRLTRKLIKNLVEANVVPNESERKLAQDKTENDQRKKTERIINSIFPKRERAKFPKEFRNIIKRKSKKEAPVPNTVEATTPKGKLVWTSKRLPASSVQVGGNGTNPTGGLRLVQDDFVENGEKIAQTTYFRNDIFGAYNWEEIRQSPYVEAATIPFEITISNESYGTFDLEVRHKPSGEAGQGNYTTSISWGTLGGVIRDANLTGKRLDLYAPKGRGKAKPFHIIIS